MVVERGRAHSLIPGFARQIFSQTLGMYSSVSVFVVFQFFCYLSIELGPRLVGFFYSKIHTQRKSADCQLLLHL